MEPDFSIGQDDTGPILEEQLFGPDGLTPLPQVQSVQFRMKPRDESSAAILIVGSVFDVTNAIVRVQVTTATPGWWRYGWIATLLSGEVVTVPAKADRDMYIKPKIV